MVAAQRARCARPRNGVWGVATYAHVKQVSSQPKLFSSAGGIRPDSGPSR